MFLILLSFVDNMIFIRIKWSRYFVVWREIMAEKRKLLLKENVRLTESLSSMILTSTSVINFKLGNMGNYGMFFSDVNYFRI